MRDLLIMGLVFGLLPLAFSRPYVGALMWVWISLMNPHRLTWGMAYGFPFAMLTAATTVAGVFVSSDRGRFPAARETTILLLMAFWFTLTTTVALIPDGAWYKWNRVIKILIMTIVPLFLLQERNRLRLLLLVMAISIGYFSVKGGISSLITGGRYRIFGPSQSFISDNNALAVAELMVLPFMWFLARSEPRKWFRRGLYLSAPLTIVSIIFSYSRGALLGLIAMVTVLIVTGRRWGLAIAFVLLAGVGLAFVPSAWYERMQTIGSYKEDESAQSRFQSWTFAWNVATDRPLTGGGFRIFSKEGFVRYTSEEFAAFEAHSIYFEVLGEHGFVGLGLFLMLLVSAFTTLNSVERQIRGRPVVAWAKDYAIMLRLSVVSYAVGGAFLGLAYFDLYYDVIAAVILLKIVVHRELAQEAAAYRAARTAELAPPPALPVPAAP
ncbi:MAG TPA: putative O-glycosylation ligase, exosortase A system-associated [Candidatus Eisenbacteria bacterium]|jgi:probable O-glycosylation ligase (exosortase A-associated)|nr:putative O-glycosylation ligase, exosortase A system-associated [Candidatus Eisenbacteria bacterium]